MASRFFVCVSSALIGLVSACGAPQSTQEPSSEPSRSTIQAEAEDPSSQTLADTASLLASYEARYKTADLNKGARHWRRCQACHTLTKNGRHMVGPNLHGLFSRKVGTAQNYRYSSALDTADFNWSPDLVEQWLESPREFLPGNRMSFAGLRKDEDRRDLTAYLIVETRAD